jgi:hypothetical protein
MTKLTKVDSKGRPVTAKAKRFVGVRQSTQAGDLIWDPRETEGMTHAQAEAYIAKLNQDEPDMGWRLPTVDELCALADRTKFNPAIDKNFFAKCKSDWYWTSTPAAYSPSDCAWIVDFYGGSADWSHRDGRAFVRAVRPSQLSSFVIEADHV